MRNLIVMTTYKGIHQYGKRSGRNRAIIEREVPAIISVEQWERAQEVLRNNMAFANRNSKRYYLLRGLIKCSLCGLTYVGSTDHYNNSYYGCMGKNKGRGPYGAKGERCPSKYVAAKEIEAAVWSDIEGFLRDPGKVIEALRARMQGQESEAACLRDEAAQAQRLLQALSNECDTVLTLYRKGRIDEAALDRQLDDVQQQEATLRIRIEALTDQARVAEAASTELQTAESILRELNTRLDHPLTWETQRRLVETLRAFPNS